MILAIDIGNTNMEFGIFSDNKLRGSFRLGTNRDITSDEVGLMMRQYFLINNIDINAIEDIIISSVVPQVMYSISNALGKYIGKSPLIVGSNMPINIDNKYGSPSEVGADRLVNALAAYRKYGGPVIVVDFGTATTFDAIDGDGAYLGGAIYPGIKISTEALFEKTAKLPRVELKNPGTIIGKNTVMSMQAGVIYGYVGAVEKIVEEMKLMLGSGTNVTATGGFSKLIGKNSDIFDNIDRTLTIDGLLMIYNEYKENPKGAE